MKVLSQSSLTTSDTCTGLSISLTKVGHMAVSHLKGAALSIQEEKTNWDYFFNSKNRFQGTQQHHQVNTPVPDFYTVKYLDKKQMTLLLTPDCVLNSKST